MHLLLMRLKKIFTGKKLAHVLAALTVHAAAVAC